MGLETNERRQRLKRMRKWPKRVRAPFLLKRAFRVGVLAYRIWRFWYALSGGPGD